MRIYLKKMVDQKIEEFANRVMLSSEDDKNNLDFISGFAKWLMERGLVFGFSYNSKEKKAVFMSLKNSKFPLPITLIFESGVAPICSWRLPGETKSTRKVYDSLQICESSTWYQLTFQHYLFDID